MREVTEAIQLSVRAMVVGFAEDVLDEWEAERRLETMSVCGLVPQKEGPPVAADTATPAQWQAAIESRLNEGAEAIETALGLLVSRAVHVARRAEGTRDRISGGGELTK